MPPRGPRGLNVAAVMTRFFGRSGGLPVDDPGERLPPSRGLRIEHGVPVPPRERCRRGRGFPLGDLVGKRRRYPWRSLSTKPGDSFFVPGFTRRMALSVTCSGRIWCRKNAPHLTCVTRKIGDGMRVWFFDKRKKA